MTNAAELRDVFVSYIFFVLLYGYSHIFDQDPESYIKSLSLAKKVSILLPQVAIFMEIKIGVNKA